MDANDDKQITMLRARITMDTGKQVLPAHDAKNEGSDEGSSYQAADGHDSGNDTRLCARCENICQELSRHPNLSRSLCSHYDTVLQLEESATNGCAMCHQFMRGIVEYDIGTAKDKVKQQRSAEFSGQVKIGRVDFRIQDESFFEVNLDFRLNTETSDNVILRLGIVLARAHSYGHMARISDRPHGDTSGSLPMASQWLKVCQESHQECNKNHERTTPTRLVSTDLNNTRLVLRNELEGSFRYATLSHCWGKSKFALLSKSNLDTFREKIPKEALSQTFKDAITVARELELPYIWIDSLCIVQDDNDDWLQEAASMSSVYGGSSLNIAASGASDGTNGCFFTPCQLVQCRVFIKIHGRILPYQCYPQGLYDTILAEMPLMKRAWAFQERLLPSRTLHFTSTQLFWECHEKIACETFPDNLPPFLKCNKVWNSFFNKKPVTKSMWWWIVQWYSRCELTMAKDKFPAISGLARIVSLQSGDEYVAGMWRKDLELQLCWVVFGRQRCRKTAPYIAPTWSWASLNATIVYPLGMRNEKDEKTSFLAQVLDVRLQPAGPDPLGQLASASLQLGCSRMLQGTLRHDRGWFMTVGNEDMRLHAFLDEINLMYEVIVVPLLERFDRLDSKIWGLIIEPTKQKPGQYRRLGVFWTVEGKDTLIKASTTGSWGVEESEVVGIKTDEHGKTLLVIEIV